MWTTIRTGLMRAGHVLGSINNFILLSLVYLLLFPWLRIWWLISRSDPLGYDKFKLPKNDSAWSEPDTPAAPSHEDMEHLF